MNKLDYFSNIKIASILHKNQRDNWAFGKVTELTAHYSEDYNLLQIFF